MWASNVCLDNQSVYLFYICIIFFVFFNMCSYYNWSLVESSLILVSLFFGALSFFVTHSLIFWFVYELAILPLLFLIYFSSPYSERYLAGWYLSGYILLTSLPMLFILLYCSLANGSFALNISNSYLSIVLFILFITKIPLFPFFSWLPVVHAEASTPVSMMLSGYVMKLGIIGVYRFCWETLSLNTSLTVLLFFISLVYFINALFELDVKRWLAYLSLSHILVSVIGFNCLWANSELLFFYALGHGLSAGLLFYLFGYLYLNSGSRNWVILCSSKNVNSISLYALLFSLLSVASFPPSISFVTEVGVLIESGLSNGLLFCFSIYLLIGAVIPMLIIARYLVTSNVKLAVELNSAYTVIPSFLLIIYWLLGVLWF